MSDINYCANGCTRRHGDEYLPVTTEGKSQLCNQCESRFHDWLTKIPENYALAPMFVEHGTTDKNPESKATKSANAPAPMRLDIIDLLDTRRGRKWNGTEVTEDRRGTIGTLQAYASELIDTRPLTATPLPTSVSGCCALLDRHRLWLTEQEWIPDAYADIKKLHRSLSDAIGDYRQKPVGKCHTIPENAETACGGSLFAGTYGGVHCARCGATWDADHLRQLGLAQATAQESA